MHICRAAGCDLPVSGYSRLCRRHKSQQRRHGDPAQRTIGPHELKPHRATIETLRRRDPESRLWPLLEGRWQRLIEEARAVEAEAQSGRPFHRPTRDAALTVLRVAAEADPAAVIDTMLAMFLMWDRQPGSFASDRGFRFQLVRRFRALAPAHFVESVSHTDQRPHRAYRDASPRSVERLADILIAAFAGIGGGIARRLEKERQDKANERAAVSEALDKLRA